MVAEVPGYRPLTTPCRVAMVRANWVVLPPTLLSCAASCLVSIAVRQAGPGQQSMCLAKLHHAASVRLHV